MSTDDWRNLSIRPNVLYGWFVVAGCSLVFFGVAGSQFSFGVFMKPMTDDFSWNRTELSLAFGIAFMLSGLLRPFAGYLADRYNPKTVALSGVALMGVMLLTLPWITSLAQLYAVFAVMSIGLTLGTGPSLTKVVGAWFHRNRGLALGLTSGGSSIGAILLVPGASLFVVLFDWQTAYVFLGVLLLAIILPVGYFLIKNRPEDMGMEPLRDDASSGDSPEDSIDLDRPDSTFADAFRTTFFWRLTFGFFV